MALAIGRARFFARKLASTVHVTQTSRCLSSVRFPSFLRTDDPTFQLAFSRVTVPAVVTSVFSQKRRSHSQPTSVEAVTDRVMIVLKCYDKINPDKLTLDSHFVKDLGLDSLDNADIVMEMEAEFMIEIPDDHADRLQTPRLIVEYVCDLHDSYPGDHH